MLRTPVPSLGPSRALCTAVPALAGTVLIGLAWIVRRHFADDPGLGSLDFVLHQTGLLVVLLSFLPARGVRPRFFLGLGLAILATVCTVGMGEFAFRRLGADFRGQQEAWERLPPFARVARTPTGPVFFRRSGPESWTGAVLRTSLQLRGQGVPPVYQVEPEIIVRYDRFGFRDEDSLDDWELVVAGDSFTELGYLPFDQLFTTLIAGETGLRVRNLGVSGTGPFTHLSYLKDFGLSRSLEHALIVFFEGNDLQDMAEELEALSIYQTTGERPFREFAPQSSLLAALGDLWRQSPRVRQPSWEQIPIHYFQSSNGEIPVHIRDVIPLHRRLPEGSAARLEQFCREYRAFGIEHEVSVSLAYMPCKARVLHGRLRPADPEQKGATPWWPAELPELVAQACERHDIRFIDLTPTLVEAAQIHGELVFNSLLEIHLNARGSERVGLELAQHFQDDTLSEAEINPP